MTTPRDIDLNPPPIEQGYDYTQWLIDNFARCQELIATNLFLIQFVFDQLRDTSISFTLFDATEAVVVGDGAGFVTVENIQFENTTLVDASAVHNQAAGAGGPATPCRIQINNETKAVDMFSTTLQIDKGDTQSAVSGTPFVIDTPNALINIGDVLRLDIDEVAFEKPPLGLLVLLEFEV